MWARSSGSTDSPSRFRCLTASPSWTGRRCLPASGWRPRRRTLAVWSEARKAGMHPGKAETGPPAKPGRLWLQSTGTRPRCRACGSRHLDTGHCEIPCRRISPSTGTDPLAYDSAPCRNRPHSVLVRVPIPGSPARAGMVPGLSLDPRLRLWRRAAVLVVGPRGMGLRVNGGVKMYRRGGVKMYCGLGGSLSP